MAAAKEKPTGIATNLTPSDSTDFYPTRGLYVGVSGDVKVVMADSEEVVVWTALAAGMLHPISVTRVYSTDTTATNINVAW